MAQADLRAIRVAWHVRRLYMPQAVLWGRQVLSRSYLPAPLDRVQLMDDVYQVITSASRRAAQALGTLIIDTAAPSRTVALARIATPAASGPYIDPSLDLGTLSPRLRSFDRRREWQVTRVDDLDAQAVIRAYQDQHLTLQQCAFRFATSEQLITVVLKNHDIPLHPAPRTPRPPAASDNQPRPAPSPAASDKTAAARPRHGPVEGRLQALGITDASLLLRRRPRPRRPRTPHPSPIRDRVRKDRSCAPGRQGHATQLASDRTGPQRTQHGSFQQTNQAPAPQQGSDGVNPARRNFWVPKRRLSSRRRPPAPVRSRNESATDDHDRGSGTSQNPSKTRMFWVELRGFEPLTPSMRTKM
jgi:hypothetical protein